jgi:hypothetical protein
LPGLLALVLLVARVVLVVSVAIRPVGRPVMAVLPVPVVTVVTALLVQRPSCRVRPAGMVVLVDLVVLPVPG